MKKSTPDGLQGIRVSYSPPIPKFEFPAPLPEGLAIIFVEAQTLGFSPPLSSSTKSAYPALLSQVIQEVNESIFTCVLKHTDQAYLPLMERPVLVSALLGKVTTHKADRDSPIPQPLMEKRLLVSTLGDKAWPIFLKYLGSRIAKHFVQGVKLPNYIINYI